MIEDGTRWTLEDSSRLYRVDAWGDGFFRIGPRGTVEVTPGGPGGASLDLYDLVQELRRRDLGPPLLLRFPGIIERRVHALIGAFEVAIEREAYRGKYQPIYPIKVNQQRREREKLVAREQGKAPGDGAGARRGRRGAGAPA